MVKLPESERIIEILLDEMYDSYNTTTGSPFTGFALRSEMEKGRLLNDLLDLFIAADKVKLSVHVPHSVTDGIYSAISRRSRAEC